MLIILDILLLFWVLLGEVKFELKLSLRTLCLNLLASCLLWMHLLQNQMLCMQNLLLMQNHQFLNHLLHKLVMRSTLVLFVEKMDIWLVFVLDLPINRKRKEKLLLQNDVGENRVLIRGPRLDRHWPVGQTGQRSDRSWTGGQTGCQARSDCRYSGGQTGLGAILCEIQTGLLWSKKVGFLVCLILILSVHMYLLVLLVVWLSVGFQNFLFLTPTRRSRHLLVHRYFGGILPMSVQFWDDNCVAR